MVWLWRIGGGVAVALTAGLMAGNAAVSGLASFDGSYLPPSAGTEAAVLADAAEERATAERVAASAAGQPTDADCPDCGDYAAGWKWAERHELRDDRACNNESWSFSRGCIAYVSGGAVTPG